MDFATDGQERIKRVRGTGVDIAAWVIRQELREYSFYVINRHDGTAWAYGPNKGI
jgi:hypothetical protein